MGSFDVGCGLSNLTIHCGDEAGFLILNQTRTRPQYGDYPSSGKAFLSSGTHLPFLPPVFGVYDDYGRLRDIRPTITTQILEKLFDRPIQVVMDCIMGMRYIYESSGEIYQNYMLPECRSVNTYGKPIEEVLISVGFKKILSDNGSVSFDYDSYNLALDKENSAWTITRNEPNREIGTVRVTRNADDILDAFGRHTGVYPGYSPSDHERVHLLNRLGGMFFLEDVFVKMDKFHNAEHYMNNFYQRGMARRKKEMAEFFEYLKNPTDKYFSPLLDFTEDLARDVSLPREHWKSLGAYESNEDEFLSIAGITNIAYSLNRILAPTYCGEQMGNDRASLMLNHISKQILDARKEEYEGEIDDEDEESYWDLGVEL